MPSLRRRPVAMATAAKPEQSGQIRVWAWVCWGMMKVSFVGFGSGRGCGLRGGGMLGGVEPPRGPVLLAAAGGPAVGLVGVHVAVGGGERVRE
ncbi:hypothetical protein GCM10010495_62930 [Kitasatospora herbaricolor]|nr:hypothetical protein GCM10010495_62930 [Kitasatospora herbaricolor]